jgi:hypothetical protein
MRQVTSELTGELAGEFAGDEVIEMSVAKKCKDHI